MTGKQIYKVWAPNRKKWIEWIKPIPFINIDEFQNSQEFIDYTIPNICYIKESLKDTMIIVDIDGMNSIREGIALSYLGYRPIPIFNGTNSLQAKSTTNNEIIGNLLIWGALELENIKIENDASPVFLLDSNRINRYKMNRSVFDNSWDIYPQDIPSPQYLLNNGITKIILRSDTLHKDLSNVLYKYQKNNIEILFTNGYETPKQIKIKKPKDKDI